MQFPIWLYRLAVSAALIAAAVAGAGWKWEGNGH